MECISKSQIFSSEKSTYLLEEMSEKNQTNQGSTLTSRTPKPNLDPPRWLKQRARFFFGTRLGFFCYLSLVGFILNFSTGLWLTLFTATDKGKDKISPTMWRIEFCLEFVNSCAMRHWLENVERIPRLPGRKIIVAAENFPHTEPLRPQLGSCHSQAALRQLPNIETGMESQPRPLQCLCWWDPAATQQNCRCKTQLACRLFGSKPRRKQWEVKRLFSRLDIGVAWLLQRWGHHARIRAPKAAAGL